MVHVEDEGAPSLHWAVAHRQRPIETAQLRREGFARRFAGARIALLCFVL